MKLSTTFLLVLALVVIVLAGCESRAHKPLSTAPTKTPAPEVPKDPVTSTKPFGDGVEKDEVVQATHKTELEPATPSSPTSEAATAATVTEPAEPPTVPDSAPTRPKADREPTKPGDPEKITFDDIILGMQPDMVFRPFMLTDRAKELEGKRVRLAGDMLPYDGKKVKEFILLRNNKCLYGKGGQADHLALVELREGHTLEYTSKTVRVEGSLKIVPVSGDDGNTKHLYVLEDAVVK